MTENQLHMSFKNEQTNLCDCANQDIIFNIEKYGSYLDKIRTFLVPSLEYRIRSLLEEFVYSTNSRWAKQFPCFKKFINTIITWQDSLNKVAKYNIGTMEEMIRNTIKRMIKDDLITCFLDSIILHHRLNKVCHELDALGIENNILRSVWDFVNERDYLLDCFVDCNTTMNWNNMNLNKTSCNTKESIKYKRPSARNVCNKSIEHTQPTTSTYRERILNPNQNFLQPREDNSNHYSTCVALGSQNNSINKINRSFNEKSCNTKLKKTYLKLKIIVHKVYQEDCKCSTNFNVTYLPLPCKPSNLIRRIFEADSSLTESCLIVIKQKFKNNMYNVCSCLNSVIEKLNIKLIKALCLYCEIYPGYISFKLKANKKCFFVARVLICQNICKHIQQNYSILSSKTNSKSSTEINESKCFEQYKVNGTNLNDTLECIDEETEKFNTRCSQLNQSFINDMAIDILQNEAENNNEKRIACITENVLKYVQNFEISSCNNSCNNSCNDIIGEISNMTSYVDNSEERNGDHCKVLSLTEIDCDDVEKCTKGNLKSSNSIIKTNTSTQLVNNVNCMCLSDENFHDTNNEIENIFNNKDLNSFSQATDINEHDWICSSNKNSNLENEVCNINTCSITSFVRNSEYDKQLVELNCSHFSNNNINAMDTLQYENDGSLNSAKVEIGCNSCCSCRRDDFIDITVIHDISNENIVCTFETPQGNFDAVKTRDTEHSKTVQLSSRNNSLTISVQMPRSTILSKGINLDTCYSRRVSLTSNNNKNISTVVATSDNEIVNLSTHALSVSEKENEMPPKIDKESFYVKACRAQDFIISPKKLSTSEERYRSNEDSRNSISTKKCIRAGNPSTSNVSLYRSFATTSEFTMNNKRNEFQKSDKLKKLSKLRRRDYVRSRYDIRNGTSTMIKHRNTSHRYPNDYPTEIRPQTMTKFRNSVDKSVDRIKRLIRTKLRRILFNNKISNNNKMIKNFWRNKESSKDTRRKKTSGKHIRQDYSITCSTCDCCKQGYITSSRGSSNVILTICRTKGKKSKKNIKFRNHRLTDSNKTLLSFRSNKTSPWFYDSLTSITKDIKKQQLNKNNRYDRKKKIRNVINYNRNTHPCDLQPSRTNITISSHSTKVSLTDNDSKYFGYYTCKGQDEICDNKRICKQAHNQDQRENEQVRQYGNKNKYRDVPIKCTNVSNNESIKTSLSHTWRGNARNVYQFYDISELKGFSSLRKNRQIFEEDMSDRSNDSLHKKHGFAILIDAYNDYIDDLDLDFKLRLLRYVEFCKSIKRSLKRTLRPDDIYKVSTSVPSSDL